MRGDKLEGLRFESTTDKESPMPSAVGATGADKAWVPMRDGGYRLVDLRSSDEQIQELREINDALAAKVAEWKARAEKAEAALKAAEDDRHLTTPAT